MTNEQRFQGLTKATEEMTRSARSLAKRLNSDGPAPILGIGGWRTDIRLAREALHELELLTRDL